jgi:nucleotide-binding universal stress UspA family protein
MAIRTILVPVDFSACSDAALDQAIELARQLSARLVLFHSYWVDVSMAPSLYWVVPPDFVEKLREATTAELEKIAKRAAQAGVACESRASAEPAVAAILDLAQTLPADLIAMGTHGRTGLKHVALGSTAERIVRLAPCPVLTVKEAKG